MMSFSSGKKKLQSPPEIVSKDVEHVVVPPEQPRTPVPLTAKMTQSLKRAAQWMIS